jgi:SPOR domain
MSNYIFHRTLKLGSLCLLISVLTACSTPRLVVGNESVTDKPIRSLPKIEVPLVAKQVSHPSYIVRIIYIVPPDQALTEKLASIWLQQEQNKAINESLRTELLAISQAQAAAKLRDTFNKGVYLSITLYDELVREFGRGAIALTPGRLEVDLDDNKIGPIRLNIPYPVVPSVFDVEVFSSRNILDTYAIEEGENIGTFGVTSSPGFVLSTSLDAAPYSGGNIASSPIPPVLHVAKLLSPSKGGAARPGYSFNQYFANRLGLPFFDCGYGNARIVENPDVPIISTRGAETLQFPPISLAANVEEVKSSLKSGVVTLPQDMEFSRMIANLVKQSLGKIDPYLALRESWRGYIAEFDLGLADRWPNISSPSEWERLTLIKNIMLAEREFSSEIDYGVVKYFINGPAASALQEQRLDEIRLQEVARSRMSSTWWSLLRSREDASTQSQSVILDNKQVLVSADKIADAVHAKVLETYFSDVGNELERRRKISVGEKEFVVRSVTQLRASVKELFSDSFPSEINSTDWGACAIDGNAEKNDRDRSDLDITVFRGRCMNGLADGLGIAQSGQNDIISSRREGFFRTGKPIGIGVGWFSYFVKKDGQTGDRQRTIPERCDSFFYVGGQGVSWHPEGSNYAVHRLVSQQSDSEFTWEVTLDKSADPLDTKRKVEILKLEQPALLNALAKWNADRQRLIAVDSDQPESFRRQAPTGDSTAVTRSRLGTAATTDAELAPGRYAAQVGAFRIRHSAYSVRDQVAGKLAAAPNFMESERTARVVQRGGLYHVVVGDAADAATAKSIASRIRRAINQDVIVFRR